MSWQIMALFAADQIDTSKLPHTSANNAEIHTILNVVLAVLGAVALLFVTIGGFRYVLSGGDPEAAAKAKGTILYALIGLVIIILAGAIVQWVIGQIS